MQTCGGRTVSNTLGLGHRVSVGAEAGGERAPPVRGASDAGVGGKVGVGGGLALKLAVGQITS